MRGSDIIKPGMMEDLLIKSVKPGEIVLTDPSNDEIGIIQKADQTERDKILAKIEDDIKDDDLTEKKGYSAQAAHKGKDLGKKGKNFKKIANKASKEYGSKEAGERVAGAVLAKLRKESVETDQNLMMEGMSMFISGELDEKLKPSMGLGAYIKDFEQSKNKRFAGKSKEDRIKMAKGAYYGATKESVDEAYDPKTDIEAGYQYYVIDKQSKKIVGKYRNGVTASNAVDKKDNAYGGYRYSRKRIDSMLTEESQDVEHLALTPEMLLRSMEWARESSGEDIQLHKYVESVSQVAAEKGIVSSDDYEEVIAKVSPNDPNVTDEGPDTTKESDY